MAKSGKQTWAIAKCTQPYLLLSASCTVLVLCRYRCYLPSTISLPSSELPPSPPPPFDPFPIELHGISWHFNEIGKSENCIIIKSNQHEIKCLKWKFYRESFERSTHRMCLVRAPRVWVREVDRRRNIIYSVRFCHYWLTNLIFMLETVRWC